MNWQRAVAFGAAGGALAAWVAGAAMTTPPPVTSVQPWRPTPADVHGAALQSEILRLRERLRPSQLPAQPSRNLFSFAAAPQPIARPSADATSPLPAVAPAAAPVVQAPPVSLIGLAEERTAGGTIRTAIISGFGDVFLVKEGDAVGSRYRAGTIGVDGVILIDTLDGTTTTLHLK